MIKKENAEEGLLFWFTMTCIPKLALRRSRSQAGPVRLENKQKGKENGIL